MAGDAATKQPTSSCVWRIDRFDLIFYNARHKRWQFFAEDPAGADVGIQTEGEGLHRYQIRSLLSKFREAVQSVFLQPGLKPDVFELREYARESRASHIDLTEPTFAEWSKYKQLYLECLIQTGWYDGVPKPHRLELQAWFKDPKALVSREAALTFLSLLPILEDWDTWGCFVRAKNHPDRSTASSFPPAAGEWSEPFYMVELDFRNPEVNGVDKRRSEELLGYRVILEGVCLDLTETQSAPQRIGRADFFDDRYCKYPEGDELTPYRCYAALVDQIMRKLAGAAPEQRQFVVAYPVAIGGRLHFLQVALSPGHVDHSCVDALWNDWQPIHRRLWVPSFKAFLQEEIYRITTCAFQSEVYDALSIEFSERHMKSEEKAKRCQDALWEHVYHLFPVKAVSNAGKRLAYMPLRLPKTQAGKAKEAQIRLGSEWRELWDTETPERLEERIGTIEVDQARLDIPHPAQDGFHRLIEEHRIGQSILEQKRFLERLHEGLLKAEKDAAKDRERCFRVAVAYGKRLLADGNHRILNPGEPDLDQLLGEEIDMTMLGSDLNAPEGREPLAFFTKPRSFGRYLAQAFPGNPADQLMSLKRILRPSLVQQLSEYFETGPVKVLTHLKPDLTQLREYWGGSLELFNASFLDPTQYFPGLAADIDRRLGEVCTASQKTFTEYHDDVVAFWRTVRVLLDTDEDLARCAFKEALATRRQELLFQAPTHPGNRWFLLDPEKLIKHFVTVYQRKNSDPMGLIASMTIERDIPASPYLGKAPVYAVEHYWPFPYTIHDLAKWGKSDLWTAWVKNACGGHVGELYYFDGKDALLLVPQSPLDTHLMSVSIVGMRLRFVRAAIPSPALVIVCRHWRMDQVTQGAAGGD